MKTIYILAAFILLFAASASAGEEASGTVIVSEEESFRLVQLAAGLPHPWGMAFLPGGDLLVTGRQGVLWRVDPSTGGRQEIGGLPRIRAAGQGGLLDIALHPDYRRNGWIYLAHTAETAFGRAVAVSRGRLSGNRLTDVQRIYTASGGGRTQIQYGTRLAFDGKGHLFVSLGDRGEADRAQRPADPAGSIIRLTEEGGIPSDNPFMSQPGKAAGEVYSYGHRNPQGLFYDPASGILWEHEHGPKGGDEVNIIRPGLNYGWPEITYGIGYDGRKIGNGTEAPGMEQPVTVWVPSIAPSGLLLYTGDRFPGWKGNLFAGALAGKHLRRLTLKEEEVTSQEMLLSGTIGRIRDVRQGPDGMIYLLTDEQNGGVYRLEPAARS